MEEKSKTFSIEIEGVVQGVGFRPFIYNLAKELNLTGFVRNTKKGLQIEITGPEAKLNSFIERIKTNPPRLSIIKNLVYSEKDSKYLNYFEIIESVEGKESNIFLSPDISVCSDCEKDFFDIESPYYKYPFVNCTNCGPRFSIILDYPYDRKNTTMKKFPMCPSCEKEYYDISSRRYHAQPISCHKCGPQFKLYDKFLNEITTENIFEELTTLISNGNIIAVKGVGGYHLILSATDKNAVQRLRELKKRDRKPFALLFKDINLVRKFAYLSDYEEEVLKGKERPILLLKKKKGLIEGDFDPISGHSPYYGVMLPYTPFHFLILEKNPILICTSANISGEPIVYREEDLKRIENIADYFLIHNRDIERFVEDSVVKILETPFLEGKYQKIFFRKSRGYAPAPLFLEKKFNKKILGFGSDLKATISILRDDNIIQSQYLGDLADYESYLAYKRTYEDIRRIYEFHPEIYVSDLHPSYLSTKFAEEIAGSQNLFKVQHHKAHIASVCIENNIFEPVIGIALDGTGYGEDGMIWGGEVFVGDLEEGFERRGHLSYTPFPFGDLAVKDPERSYLCYLTSLTQNDESLYNIFSEATASNLKTLTKIISETEIFTSSTGRLFDCVSYLLGFRKRVSFEGEPAIELENLIYRKFSVEDDIGNYDFAIKTDKGNYIIDVKTILHGLFEDYIRKIDNEIISVKFHSTIVSAFSEVVFRLSKDFGIKKIALSGGSFQNSYLLYNFLKKLHFSGLSPYINRYSPPNDACISIGQCALLSIS